MDRSGDIIGRWPSARQCAVDLGIHHYLVTYYAKTMGTMKDGRIFRYEDGADDVEFRKVVDMPDYPCITCRRFSRRGQQPTGYCMRLRKNVGVYSTCGEHEYPMSGRFIR